QLGVGDTIIPILVSAFAWSIAIAVGASIAVGVGFTLKDMLPGSIIGASTQRSILKVGQKVKIGDVTGTITASHLLHVIVTNDRNESIVIPTKSLMNQSITIYN
ncbi:MAG: mechanosensitive ion channel, partial [Nitrosarchaeum sp.]